MTTFRIRAKNRYLQDVYVVYDSHNSTLTDEQGNHYLAQTEQRDWVTATAISKENPGRKEDIKTLKIQLGLSCNYSCTYCNQRFVPHADSTNKNDIDDFIESIKGWFDGSRIEFWGGEPLVYMKTLKPLAERLRGLYPDVQFTMITNGSLLTKPLNEWLDMMGFAIAISHDGPGQHVRGPDPLDDEKSREGILDLYHRLAPQGRISFSTMMNNENLSRGAVSKFFIDLTGDPNVSIGEGVMISPYDEGGMSTSLNEDEDHVKYRRMAQAEIRSLQAKNFQVFQQKVVGFIQSIQLRRPHTALGQKCGMDKPGNLAMDLKGNVLSCQNVSAVSTALNGESHNIGHVSKLDEVALNTSRHWTTRENCSGCPVLQLCQGSCMFLEGPLWDKACDASFSDNVVFMFAAIEAVTGLIPYYIESDYLPENRKDVFGVFTPQKKKKTVIPIMAIK